MFWCLWFSFWFGLLITTLSFTCLHSLRTLLLINGSIKISLFFLFSYSCYHLRYSFVPCKYVPCHHHTSIFLTYWFTSIQDRFCYGDKTGMLNSTSFFFFLDQLWKAALLRREEEETFDQDLMSRPQQLWAVALGACDDTSDRTSESVEATHFQMKFKGEPKYSRVFMVHYRNCYRWFLHLRWELRFKEDSRSVK